MGRDKLAYFNQHVGGIAILSEPEISKKVSVAFHQCTEWTAIHGVEVLFDIFLLAGNGSCGKVISYNEILVVLVCWVFTNPSSTKQFFELCCHVTVVIVSQHGNEQTLSKSARTEKNWCFVTLKQWNIVGLVHIIISLVANLCKVRHSVWNGNICL